MESNLVDLNTSVSNEEETNFLLDQENYQDLSSWVLDPLPMQPEIPLGEFSTMDNNSEIKMDDNNDLSLLMGGGFIAKEENNIDVINYINNNDSDSFDLLSFLCEDDAIKTSEVTSKDVELIETTHQSMISLDNSRINLRGRKNQKTVIKPETITSPVLNPLNDEIKANSSKSIPKLTNAKIVNEKKKRGRSLKRPYDDNNSEDEDVDYSYGNIDDDDDESRGSYKETREKNNEASRRSRLNKKLKEMELHQQAVELERINKLLKSKAQHLEKLVITMRETLLQSVLQQRVKS